MQLMLFSQEEAAAHQNALTLMKVSDEGISYFCCKSAIITSCLQRKSDGGRSLDNLFTMKDKERSGGPPVLLQESSTFTHVVNHRQ